MIRLLNTPIERVNIDEGSETLHSFKEYIDTIHQYSGSNYTGNCNSEDEESSHENSY
jgi:hypothetical protein